MARSAHDGINLAQSFVVHGHTASQSPARILIGNFLRTTEHNREHRPFGYYQISRRSDGLAIGGIGFKDAPTDGVVEIGYGLVPSARGRGYAAEALVILVQLARGLEVTTICAETDRHNVASQRTLESAGFDQVRADSQMYYFRVRISHVPTAISS